LATVTTLGCSGSDGPTPQGDSLVGVEVGRDAYAVAIGRAPDGVAVVAGADGRVTWLAADGSEAWRAPGLAGGEPLIAWGTSLLPGHAVGLRRTEGTAYAIVVLTAHEDWSSWELPFDLLDIDATSIVLRSPTEVMLVDGLGGAKRCTPAGCTTAWTGVPEGATPVAWDDAGVRFAWIVDSEVCTGVFGEGGLVGATACAWTESTSVIAAAAWQDPDAVQVAVDRNRPDLAAITLFRLTGSELVRGATIAGTSVAVVPGSARVHLASPDWSVEITGPYVPTLHAAEQAEFVETAVDDFFVELEQDGAFVDGSDVAWCVAGTSLFVIYSIIDEAGLVTRARRIPLPEPSDPYHEDACTLACPEGQSCDWVGNATPICELPNPYFDPHTGRPIVSVRAELAAVDGFAGPFTVTADPLMPTEASIYGAEGVFDPLTGRGTALWMLPEYTTWALTIEVPGFTPIHVDEITLPSAGDLVDLGEYVLEMP
jgi:hypothetical protein